MTRFSAAFVAALVCTHLFAAEPSTIDRTLAIQKATAEARGFLTANQPADAVKSLEAVMENAKGDTEFLGLLRDAYTSELKQQRGSRSPSSERIATLETRLAVLQQPSGTTPRKAPQISEVNPAEDFLKQAADLFNQARTQPAKFADAAKFFNKAYQSKLELSQDQLAAWAYCRVKLAADTWNRSTRDATATHAAVREIEDSLKLAPNYAELQTAGRKLIVEMGGKPSLASAPSKSSNPFLNASHTEPTAKAPAGNWLAVESENFRVRYQGSQEPAQQFLKRAEEARQAIFTKWSSPEKTAWKPKCDVILHATSKEFTTATEQPAGATGHAFVKLEAKQATERRIDLRLDDEQWADDTFGRELSYVILADLFPDREVPKWAAIGMAVLGGAPSETDRCEKTLQRCYKAGELFSIVSLLDLKDGPRESKLVTPYYVESVSLVDHLVRKQNAKNFRIFLLDAQRYGTEKALERQYGYRSVRELDTEWRRAALSTSRGQQP